ncbi:metalloprotease PmbA [Polynucleobacter paneuropaeus]|jgi:PmbA protein|uniref:Metalloprotease PmbA n=1 Tax=Polynucleobacter paneuropaeus TaxID=2527775 RepID=A0A9Q2WIS2_9BURK|nr:metalloprotease PmbA [Polynucleobacter paneuropaeus]AWW44809.1 metalloprotease PmbA [Polynucleobacter paneuropaeus]AWW48299.1 metalloprotease PmbA [Polynucleobacter paneuropaeus]MBT8517954.1 metalloprotease PmbA [Polynucleobacter paneuropaeus]MBT8522228.1 metalloprotease PmbA [Polynucleobacter paneuropaeus]MBT8522831.1 metalloprotease PmbA [Polynucleobacter paneuropaeus]
MFTYSSNQFQEIIEFMLAEARRRGASDAIAEVSEGQGLAVTVRKGEVETIEQSLDKQVGVTVFLGQRRGNASTSDFSQASLRATVEAAYHIAQHTAEDDCAGPAEPELLEKKPKDLDLFHSWAIDAIEAVEIARAAEAAAFAVSKQIRNSDGASVSAHHGHFMMGTTNGFMGGYPFSRHYISCAPIANGLTKKSGMQRDDWYSSSRVPKELAEPAAIGKYAAQRALSRLNAKSISTRRCPVIFEAPLAAGLMGGLVQAVSGGALYRKSSFLLDSLGKAVLPKHVSLIEEPHHHAMMGSAPFDEEGVKTHARTVVDQGILQGYFLSTYSARKLGMKTTGNAGGSHHLTFQSKKTCKGGLPALLKEMGTGLLVTELMGQGVNYVTGDYSRGAFGYWVENGEIQYPVEEVTIAGNLRDMLMDIAMIGSDTLVRGSKETGSILIGSMTVGGK